MELFKIFGTLALKGVDSAEKELKDLTGEAEKSSSKLSKFGSVMKGIGKGVLVTTGAVATGSVALIKKVSSSYGALQQSIGGIETLFKDSSDKVIQNANNAFKTAGISANEYMQQVTSFSASLLQALDGDTEKACESADMAIRDMADNANKMGTSMEMIQNAYQGFSKQNYTMLDNLKLGYGGTKTEMERLLKDAQKITGIKYDISNLDDVYQAIHVIQQELGITGTTAKEAGETIEGSFNSLGASWQNFLAGLGDPNADMKILVENLASGLSGAINNVIPVINNMVAVLPTVMDALVNAISQMLPTLIETFTSLIVKVIDAIVKLLPEFIPLAIDCVLTVAQAIIENLPLIIDAGIQLIVGLGQGLIEALPTLIPIIVDVLIEVVDTLLDNLELITEVAFQLIVALGEGLINALPKLIEYLPKLIYGIVNTLASQQGTIVQSGWELLMSLIKGIVSAVPKLISQIPNIIMAFVNGLMEGASKFFDVGKNLMSSLWDGLKSIWNSITNWFGDCWNNVSNWFGGLFGGKSSINVNLGGGKEYYADGAVGVMTKPTIFGYNPATNNQMVGGEAGIEAIAPISTLQQYVTEAVRTETDGLAYYFNKLIELLGAYLPDIKDSLDRPLVLDSGKVVGGIARKMDDKLGDIMTTKARFGV